MVYLFCFLLQLVVLFFFSRKVQGYLSKLFYQVSRSKKIAAYILAILFLPGTYLHELSHLFASLILFVGVGKLELIPKYQENQLKLGSVTIKETDAIRRFIIGVAPLLSGVLIIILLIYQLSIHRLIGNDLIYMILVGYIVFTVSNTMFMSKSDMAGVWKLVLFILIIVLLLNSVGFRASVSEASFLYSESFKRVMRTANFYLLFPLAIDFVIVLFGRILKKSQ